MSNEILKTFLRARTNFVLAEVILSLQQGYLTHNISIFESALVWTFLHYSEEDFSYTIAVQSKYWSVNQTQLMGCISLACCHFSLAEPGTVCLSSERVLNNYCSLQCLNRDQHADAFFLVHLPEGKVELGAQLRDRGIHQTCGLVKKGRVLKLWSTLSNYWKEYLLTILRYSATDMVLVARTGPVKGLAGWELCLSV